MDLLPPSNQDQSLQQSVVEEELKNINNGEEGNNGDAGGNSEEGGEHGSNRLKRRGRRRGSRNKAKLPRNEAWAHVLEVTAGQDILESVARFARRNCVGVNVINGSGAVSTVTIQDPAGADVGLQLQGQFEIISLSGSILPSPSPPAAQWLAVCLAGEQGQVVGGRAVGPMVAATMVVIVALLLEDTAYERPSLTLEVVDGSLQGSPALPPPPQQLLGNVVNGNIPVLDVPLHPSPRMVANMVNQNTPVLESPLQRWPAFPEPTPPQQLLSNVVAGNIPVLDGSLQESPTIQPPLQQQTGGMVDGNIPPPFNGQLPADEEHGWWGDGQVMDSLWNWDA